MDARKFTPERIIGFLKEVEAGATVTQVCRRYGIAHLQYYKWRVQYGGMEAEELTRLRELQAENDDFRKLLAEAHLEIALLRRRLERMPRTSGSG